MQERFEQLAQAGQSLWYDNIRRGMIESGELASLVADGVVGLTSNPTIFEKAINGSDDYDRAIEELIAAGQRDEQAYLALVTEDIRGAADILRPVYDSTEGADGYASLEVSPKLAFDTEATITQARELFAAVGRPNLMIKIPATEQGLPAIRATIAAGINVNVTLIFSCDVYRRVMDAYISGLEDLHAAGGKLSGVASVASFFVSRVDSLVDKLLEEKMAAGTTDLEALLGQAAIANARVAYQLFCERFGEERFSRLAHIGARRQRPLWASTSTKNPAYPDTYYVDNLIGPDTVNTVPADTLVAFADHGTVANTIDTDIDLAHETLSALGEAGIDMDEVTEKLRVDGVQSFADSFDKLMSSLRGRMAVT
jgi:transaldolase